MCEIPQEFHKDSKGNKWDYFDIREHFVLFLVIDI